MPSLACGVTDHSSSRPALENTNNLVQSAPALNPVTPLVVTTILFPFMLTRLFVRNAHDRLKAAADWENIFSLAMGNKNITIPPPHTPAPIAPALLAAKEVSHCTKDTV